MSAPSEAHGAPKVSVLLPVRSAAETLPGAAESILRQSFTDFELLIVDDGSTDGTAAAAAALAATDPRVRALRQEALGPVTALNLGLQEARAALIAVMDADSVAHEARLARQVMLLEQAPEVAFVGAGWRALGRDGQVRRVVRPPAGDAGLRAAMATANVILHPTVMLRREAAISAGSYRPAFAPVADYDLWLRLLDRHSGAAIPDPLLDHREGGGPVTWRELEQLILSEMGAVAAQDRRQVGRPDHGDGKSPLDRTVLHRMGMTEAEVGDAMLARALNAAEEARASGQFGAMRRAALLGWNLPGLERGDRMRFALLWAEARLPFSRARSARAP